MGKLNNAKRIILAVVLLIVAVIVLFARQKQFQDNQYNGMFIREPEYGENETGPETQIIEEISGYESQAPPPETAADPENEPEEAIGPAESPVGSGPRIPAKAKRIYQDKFDRLRAIYGNGDIIGIIKIPDSVVYYPVAHSEDSNEYYLDRNLYKNRSAAGSICLDYENDVGRYDPNTILYGHQMSSNSMFHTISYYLDEDFFYNHRYVIFNTIYEDNVWEVFAFFKTTTDYKEFPYIKVFFRSERDFLDLAREMKKRSLHDTGIEIKEGDRILTLSTCTNLPGESDYRYVLVARMIKNKADVPEYILSQMSGAVEEFK